MQLVDFLVAVCLAKIAELHQKELVTYKCWGCFLITPYKF